MNDKFPDAFPLAWPIGWKRTKTWDQKRGQFTATFGKARDEVIKELGRMGVPDWNVIISTNMPLRRDGLPYSGKENPGDAGVAVYFRKNEKPFVLACDTYKTLSANLWAIVKTIDALRGIERWGASDMMERAFTGFAALPPPPAPETPRKQHWWQELMLDPAASPEQIKATFREYAKVHHPDKGGNSDRWLRIRTAYEEGMEARGVKL